MPKTGQGY